MRKAGGSLHYEYLLVPLMLLGIALSRARSEDAPKPPIPVANKADLGRAVGSEVSVSGKVTRTGKSSSGHLFLNFASNPQFAVFIEAKIVKKFTDADPSKAYTGKTVAVRGKLERYQGKLQIRLESPGQISLLAAKPAAGEKDLLPKPIELKSFGKDAWISPAGLRYVGKDPDGLSRKDHVLRHARDIPDREGPHGVFDGGAELAFAWIDAAWEKAQADKVRPVKENGREAYTISLGRRVGFLGGKTGAKGDHPPLTKVFIVIRSGTKEVITAFPR